MKSAVMKLRAVYALMILFVALAILLMAVFLIDQVRNGGFHGGPIITYAIIDILIVFTLGRIIWRSIRQSVLTRRWLTRFYARKHIKQTRRLNHVYRHWGTEIIVVQDDTFVALTIGLLRPRIVVSTAVLEMMDDEELEAILLHERYHGQHYDGIKLFFSTMLSDAFRYMPIMKPIFHYDRTWKELFADRYVIREMGTERYLGQVLLKLAKHVQIQRVEGAVHLADTTLQYRIIQVLEPDQVVKVPLVLLRPLMTTCLLLLFLMLGGDS